VKCITDKCLEDFFSEHWAVKQIISPSLVILLLGIEVSKRTVLCMRIGAVAIIQRASMGKERRNADFIRTVAL
jgi:hypothetical protein